MTMYQLRRLHLNQNSQIMLPEEAILLFQTTRIGRNPDMVDVILVSKVHSNMISREHTTIFVRVKRERYACYIKDHSLNGTFVNDFRVVGEVELKQGDVIKFGHVNGAAIKPGCYGPQTAAEFTFVFEEAPEHRITDRRRPITIEGHIRQDSSLTSQAPANDGINLIRRSRTPINPSIEVFPTWQNPNSAGAAANPYYNLQRFPNYYQAAFPQFNPAYLQSLWPPNSWPSQSSSAASQQLQQHHLHQQKRAQVVAGTAQYNQLPSSAWMSANPQIPAAAAAADDASFIESASNSHLRATLPPQASSSKIASNNPTVLRPIIPERSAPVSLVEQPSRIVTGNLDPQSSHLLHPFGQNVSASRATQIAPPVTVAVPTPPTPSPAPALPPRTVRQHRYYPVDPKVVEATEIADCCRTQVIATPSAIDSVKRMECDSSVPSPPKNQQQSLQQKTTTAVFGVVPTTAVGISRTATPLSHSTLSSLTTLHAPAQVQAQVPVLLPPKPVVSVNQSMKFSDGDLYDSTLVTTENFPLSTATQPESMHAAASPFQVPGVEFASASISLEKSMQDLHRGMDIFCFSFSGNIPLYNHLSDLEELTEDLLEDCGPPKRPPTPTSVSSELPASLMTLQESPMKEGTNLQELSHSPLHHSPKKNENGNLDSTLCLTQAPEIVEGKPETKKRRKNNEVAMLLNDLTEVAWHHLAKQPTNKMVAPTQTRRVCTIEPRSANNNNGYEECGSESDLEEASVKKVQKKLPKVTDANFPKFNKSGRGGKGRRGRPSKRGRVSNSVSNVNSGNNKEVRKMNKNNSFSNGTANSDLGGDKNQEEYWKKQQLLPGNQTGISAAEKIERALDMMRKRKPRPYSDDESSSCSISSSSSSSVCSRWGPTSKRKTSSRRGGRRPRGRMGANSAATCRKISQKKPPKKTTTARKKTRRKKKRESSSSESEQSGESNGHNRSKPVNKKLQTVPRLPFDDWAFHDPNKQCGSSSNCKKPQTENVVWVQCDYCRRWFHVECVADRAVAVDNGDVFDCGCNGRSR